VEVQVVEMAEMFDTMTAEAPTNPASHPDRDRVVGAAVAFTLSLIPVFVGASREDWALLMFGGLVGIFVGPGLALAYTPKVRGQSAAGAFGTVLVMSAKAVLIGDALVTMALITLGSASGGSELVLAMAVVALLGLVIFGLPAFALAVAVLWPWSFIVRAFLGRATEGTTR
jgi:hypothetical protein